MSTDRRRLQSLSNRRHDFRRFGKHVRLRRQQQPNPADHIHGHRLDDGRATATTPASTVRAATASFKLQLVSRWPREPRCSHRAHGLATSAARRDGIGSVTVSGQRLPTPAARRLPAIPQTANRAESSRQDLQPPQADNLPRSKDLMRRRRLLDHGDREPRGRRRAPLLRHTVTPSWIHVRGGLKNIPKQYSGSVHAKPPRRRGEPSDARPAIQIGVASGSRSG